MSQKSAKGETNSQKDLFEETEAEDPITKSMEPTTKSSSSSKIKVVSTLTDQQYEEIFRAVLARYPTDDASPEADKDDFDSVLDEEEERDIVENENAEAKALRAAKDKNEVTPENSETPLKQVFQAPSKNLPAKMKPPKSKNKSHKRISEDFGHNDTPKKRQKKSSSITEKQKFMQERNIEEYGTWVQCSLPSCHKWRFLDEIYDPAMLPEVWTCPMNPDPNWSSCDIAEQAWDTTDEEDFIFIKFTEASLVWARMPGYPFWPAMVELDPDYDTYFECRGAANIATHIHVVFFDEKVSRAWVAVSNMKPFTGDEQLGDFKCTIGGVSYKKQLTFAKKQASEAFALPLNERLHCFGFASRFKGKWDIGNKEKRDSAPGGVSKGRCSEKSSKTKGKFSVKSSSPAVDTVVEDQEPPSHDLADSNILDDLDQSDVHNLIIDCEAMIKDADSVLEEFLNSQGDKSEPSKNSKKKKRKHKKKDKESSKQKNKSEKENLETKQNDAAPDKKAKRKPVFAAPKSAKPLKQAEASNKSEGNSSHAKKHNIPTNDPQRAKSIYTVDTAKRIRKDTVVDDDDMFLDIGVEDADGDASTKGKGFVQTSSSQVSDDMDLQEE